MAVAAKSYQVGDFYFREPQHPISRLQRSLHLYAGVRGRHPLYVRLFSRPIAFLLACNMFVAYWTTDHEALVLIFSDPGKFYVADPYTFLFASLMVLILGAGLYSVDTLVARYLRRRSNACLGGCVPQTDKRVGAEFLAR